MKRSRSRGVQKAAESNDQSNILSSSLNDNYESTTISNIPHFSYDSNENDSQYEADKVNKKSSSTGLLHVHDGAKRLFLDQKKGAKGIRRNSAAANLPKISHTLRELARIQETQYHSIYSKYLDEYITTEVLLSWVCTMERDNNVLLYGLGDKQRILRRFASFMQKSNVIIIDANNSIRDILNFICQDVIKKDPKDIKASRLPVLHYTQEICGLLNSHFNREIPDLISSLASGASEEVSALRKSKLLWQAATTKHNKISTSFNTKEKDDEEEEEDDDMISMDGTVEGSLLHIDLSAVDIGKSRRRSSRGDTLMQKRRYQYMTSRLYLLLNNIDSASRQNNEAQLCFSLLAECASISMLATANHLDVALLWDTGMINNFRWVYQPIAGPPHPISESSFNAVVGRKDSSTTEKSAGMEYVIASLSETHKEILRTICKTQSDLAAASLTKPADHSSSSPAKRGRVKQAPPPNSMLFSEILSKCKKSLLVKSQTEFEKLLKELTDHSVISLLHQDSTDERYITLNLGEEDIGIFVSQ